MSNSGCIQIDFGVERGSNQALLKIQKGITIAMVENIFNLCHKYKIRTFANFLVNLPNESEKDLKDITKLASNLKSEIYSFNVFTPYPGTEIYDQMKYHFTKDEYGELFNSSSLIETEPNKYRFSKHKINILKWAETQNKRFNQILPNLRFHFSFRYLKTLYNSLNKLNYLSQSVNLFKEILNQKLS